MSLIKIGIIAEIFLFVGVFLWVKKLNSKKSSKQSRQQSLSKKTIINVKF